MTPDNAAVLAAIVLAMLWPIHQHFRIRKLRHDIGQLSDGQQNHFQHITTLYQNLPHHPGPARKPMNDKVWSGAMDDVPKVTATISGGTSLQRHIRYDSPELCPDPDPTLRLRRPPALSDVAAAILTAGRPLTRATLATQLERDVRSEIRAAILDGTLEMVRTHDDEPCYWPTGHPRPGDTVRLARMPVLPGLVP